MGGMQPIFINLRISRIAAGLRQRDLAHLIGRSTSFVCRLETGGPASLTPEIAKTIAQAVNAPAAVLFAKGAAPRPLDSPTPLEMLLSVEGRSQRKALAQELEITQGHLAAIARGVCEPDAELAEKIACIIGMPFAELFPDNSRRGAA